MYEQPNSLLFIQKKQLMWLLVMIFAVVASAITFSAFLINTLVQGQVASALSAQNKYANAQVVPAATVTQSSASDGSSCAVTGGQGGGSGAASTASVMGAMSWSKAGNMPGLVGGHGSGAPASTVNNSTVTTTVSKSVTKNVNSGNTIGSNNGSDNTVSTTNNTTNTVSDSYNQKGLINTSLGGGIITANETTTVIKPVTITPVKDSFDDSGNAVTTTTNTSTSSSTSNVDSHDHTNNSENHFLSDNTVTLP